MRLIGAESLGVRIAGLLVLMRHSIADSRRVGRAFSDINTTHAGVVAAWATERVEIVPYDRAGNTAPPVAPPVMQALITSERAARRSVGLPHVVAEVHGERYVVSMLGEGGGRDDVTAS